MPRSVLKKDLRNYINLSDKNLNILIELCDSDFNRCLLEIDKIKAFEAWNTAPDVTVDDCFEVLLAEGAIYEPPYDAIFDFVDALLKKQSRKAFDLLNQSYQIGESPMTLLSVLYDNAKQLLQVQSCQNKDVSTVTGLNGWQIKNARQRCGYYKTGELVKLLKLLCYVDRRIKMGRMSDNIALEYVMVNIL